MSRKKTRNTKSKIVSAAWQLFYQQGYDDTTIDEIVEASGTSKGSFYHYFDSKDSLLTSLSYLFDEKYEELIETMDPSLSPIDKLIHMNHELFMMIENTVSVSLLSQLFSSQLVTKGERHLLGAQQDILQASEADNHRRTAAGMFQGRIVYQRYHQGLCSI